ncbi:MAG: serine/threonine protein kinase [Anaerolineae bacterium]|nr:serine/threonine protein kinase [Anaerolineae bacterium]
MSDIAVGMTVGGYEIVEELGQGGMATVYRAHQLSMHRDVAIKVLPSHLMNEPVSLERFRQEASIVARLEHRAIVPVHDYGEHEGIPYIVMRYMDGGSVSDLLEKGPIPPERTLQIIQQIAPALDYAHREGVLHRDLKPSNILLDANADAYLTDFGIARIIGTNSKPLTTTGVVGTPSYMSPEQAQGQALDGRSDVYALGVVLFEMLTGIRPFEGETPYSVAVKHVTEAAPSASDINPALSVDVEHLLYKALAKSRTMRFQTAAELALALESALHTIPIPEMMVETTPSLNGALQAGAARRDLDSWPEPDGHIQVLPPYRPTMPSHPVPLHSYPPRKRSQTPFFRLPSWLTWTMVGVLTGSLLLALILGGLYYLINVPDNAVFVEDYNATAVFKLTATKQAIQGDNHDPPTATPPPTNTPKLISPAP